MHDVLHFNPNCVINSIMTFDAEIFVKISDIATVKAGFPFRGAIRDMAGGNVLAVQMKNVDPGMGIDWAGVTRTSLPGRRQPDWLETGDIIFAARGNRNYAVHVKDPPGQAVCSPHFFVIEMRKDIQVLPAFLSWQINQAPAQRYLEQAATGSYIPNIRRQVLEDLPISVPPLLQQEKILTLYNAAAQERSTLEGLIENRKIQLEAITRDILGQA